MQNAFVCQRSCNSHSKGGKNHRSNSLPFRVKKEEKKEALKLMSDTSSSSAEVSKPAVTVKKEEAKPVARDAYVVQLGAFSNPNYSSYSNAATVGDIFC